MQLFKQNYFELFDIPASFHVDQELLIGRYRDLQSQWHPDRFASGSEQQKLQAVQVSSLLNQALDTLRTPLVRAGYLLTLKQCDIERVSQQDLGMELLMEQMQLRETLEDLPVDDSALAALDALKERVNSKLQISEQAFAKHLDADAILDAKKSYHELQFLVKLLREIEIGEEQRLDY